MTNNPKCPECGRDIFGRSDKIFCSDYCRNVSHNRENRDSNALMRNINNRLRKNWRILKKLNVRDKTKITRNKLIANDFDFTLFTSIYTTKKGNIYYFIYDQGYLSMDDDYYLLVKRET